MLFPRDFPVRKQEEYLPYADIRQLLSNFLKKKEKNLFIISELKPSRVISRKKS